jgi:hypothetical protein
MHQKYHCLYILTSSTENGTSINIQMHMHYQTIMCCQSRKLYKGIQRALGFGLFSLIRY